jgi:hypothetical protein
MVKKRRNRLILVTKNYSVNKISFYSLSNSSAILSSFLKLDRFESTSEASFHYAGLGSLALMRNLKKNDSSFSEVKFPTNMSSVP